MYISNYQIKSLTQRLTNRLGYVPKEAWVINLAIEIEDLFQSRFLVIAN
ncbi:hypothetical protein MAESPC_03818 [Microcystis aeruginosa SPC777]|uniref:Uncharacterized protein n=1 Tax=Microcystis aeruginosa SPC777 TaxID=482300 RepID=S3JH49_MICAE|nr:hypothetical protein MAESPC_03818 [Microcystis aeruginosa SPC777]